MTLTTEAAAPHVNHRMDAHWRAPRWLLAALIAALGTLGPFSVDTYLPAFAGIAQSLNATPLQMQQTLSSYLFGFGLMMLFHGALADSLGRKPVIFVGLAVFTLTSIGCAMSQDIAMLIVFRMLQGMSAGAGMVVGRAIIRDLFDPVMAQKLMSQVTLFFGIAPAIAPLIGGFLFVQLGWRSIFVFLAVVGALLIVLIWRTLPETLAPDKRQRFAPRPLLQGYREVGLNPRFLLLAIASGVPFNAMFLYILSAPAFLSEQLKLAPTQFFIFFIITISGIMAGAFMSGRIAGRWAPPKQINFGFTVMAVACLANVLYSLFFTVSLPWVAVPLWFICAGWSLLTPAVTLKVFDTFPTRLGMAASLSAFVGGCVNALVAGVLSPLVMHSALHLSIASALLMATGFGAWRVWRSITRDH
jgi:MFS transporter, DHA1 family, multidrug resistance protein